MINLSRQELMEAVVDRVFSANDITRFRSCVAKRISRMSEEEREKVFNGMERPSVETVVFDEADAFRRDRMESWIDQELGLDWISHSWELPSSFFSRFRRPWGDDAIPEEEVTEQVIRKQAEFYADQIAWDPSKILTGLGKILVSGYFHSMFQGGTTRGLEGVQQHRDKTLVYMVRHLSHLDYLFLGSKVGTNGMDVPSFAAGLNLFANPFIKKTLKGWRAYTVDRDNIRDILYLKILAEYTSTALQSGIHMAIFPEGTRSRTGHVIAPKRGLVNSVIAAQQNGADIYIVPTAIGYDMVPEAPFFTLDREGSQQNGIMARFGNLGDFFTRGNNLIVSFGEPYSLGEYIEGQGDLKPNDLSCNVVNHIMGRIRETVAVNPAALVAAAIDNISQQRFADTSLGYMVQRQELCDEVILLRSALVLSGVRVDPRIEDGVDAVVDTGLHPFVKQEFIKPFAITGTTEDQYHVVEPKIVVYYANTIRHHTEKCLK